MRSGLALLVAALILARMSADLQTTLGLGLSIICVVLSSGIVIVSRMRYEQAAVALHKRRRLPDGRLLAAMSALVGLLGIAAGVIVLKY